MSIEFFDGFETVGTETGLANEATVRPRINLRFDSVSAGPTPATTGFYLDTGASGAGFSWRQGANRNNWLRKWVTDETGQTYVVGASVHVPDTTETDIGIFAPLANTTGSPDASFSIFVRDNTDLVIAGTGTALNDTFADVFTPGAWHYVEAKFLINNSTGFVTVNIDDVEVADIQNHDTQDFFGNTIGIQFGGADIAGATLTDSGDDFYAMDNIYILKTSGGAPDDFLGARTEVKSLPPDGDNVTDWDTTSSGTVHYTLIDENGADASDYVETTTDTDRDEFNLTDLDDDGTIYAVKIEAEATDEGDTNNTLDVEVESGGSRSQTSHTVSDASATVYDHYAPTDPQGGGSWTGTRVDAMRAGIEFNT